jgi:hypothetical protein
MKLFCVPEDRPKEKSRRAVKRMRISTEKSPLLTTPDLNWRYQSLWSDRRDALTVG